MIWGCRTCLMPTSAFTLKCGCLFPIVSKLDLLLKKLNSIHSNFKLSKSKRKLTSGLVWNSCSFHFWFDFSSNTTTSAVKYTDACGVDEHIHQGFWPFIPSYLFLMVFAFLNTARKKTNWSRYVVYNNNGFGLVWQVWLLRLSKRDRNSIDPLPILIAKSPHCILTFTIIFKNFDKNHTNRCRPGIWILIALRV